MDATKPQVSPGPVTSEFWVTLGGIAANIVAVFVMLGYVSPTDATGLSQSVTQLLSGLQMVMVNAALIWKYVDSRQKTKSDAMHHETLRTNAVQELGAARQQLAMLLPQMHGNPVPAPGNVFANPNLVAPRPPTNQ
jgi:hypothetical protein